jgi:glycosyltransferase involved in cell wall biosynthesis
MVAIRYPEVEGGVDAMIKDLIGGLGARAEVEVFVPGDWTERQLVTTVQDRPRHALRLRLPFDPQRPVSGFIGWLSEFPCTVRALVRLLGERRIDVVHLHTVTNLGAYFRLAGRLAGVPYVVTLHGSDVTAFDQRRWHERALVRWTLAGAAGIAAVSTALGQAARTHFALPSPPRVIRNGIDVGLGGDRAAVREGIPADLASEPFILSAGALDHVKGHDLLIRAWASVAPEFPDVQLVLAGEGDEGAERRRLAAALGIGARVRFTGALPRAQVLALMRRARLFVLPSRREGLPYALLEAGIAGIPTVATAVGGVGEIVAAGETGLLVPPEDPEALAVAIRRLLGDEGLRRRLAAALAARVRADFSSTAMADGYLDLYAAARTGNARR